MPGLVGFTDPRLSPNEAREVLRQMQELVSYGEGRHRDELFSDGRVHATRSHTNIIQSRPQPVSEKSLHVWLDGEFYNRDELVRMLVGDAAPPAEPTNDAAVLLALYRQHGGFDFLKIIDGIYAAVLYDADKQQVHLIGDRYGLRQVFWTRHREGIAWASEVKAMLALPGFGPKIDPVALNDFFTIGHMLQDRTWFEGVELLAAGTVLTWDERERSVFKHRYWWWDQILPMTGKIDETEVAEELGRLFVAAVERRSREGEQVGLTLSGGLDSRANLAAVAERRNAVHAVTWGQMGCDDIRFAAAAARVKGAVHHVSDLNSDNWLMPRLQGVWWTDGHLNLMHLHVITILPQIRGLFSIYLDGFWGDGTIGGLYIGDREFSEIEQLDNRSRRFIALGPKTLRAYVESRLPFSDNKFIELAMSMPQSLRKNFRLYRKMLLMRFPEFYKTIPWQHTGSPIRWPYPGEGIVQLLRTGGDKLLRVAARFGLNLDGQKDFSNFSDYAKWIRQEPSSSFLKKELDPRTALYPAYLSAEQVQSDLASHFNGQDKAETLCRVLTFEIWLRQVFEGKYRKTAD